MLFLNGINSYSQDFADELILKLPKPDQYKILKARTFYARGKVFIAKSKEFADSAQLSNDPTDSKDELKINEYYYERINASYCFKTSNGLYFSVLDKNIKLFWKKHKNDKESLAFIVKLENASYDSVLMGDKLRATAERKDLLRDKIPLVAKAENMEETAIFNLSKVLYAYLNWPAIPDSIWLYSSNISVPVKTVKNDTVLISRINPDTVRIKKDSLNKSSSLYNLLHISENQIDKFNEFLEKNHPDKMQSYLTDFQKIYDSTIDSLHIEWRKYLNSGLVPPDTLKANDFIYKVQIAASRVKMSIAEQKKIYSGNEIIDESYEDQWYKYTIGSFETYNKAHEFRDELKTTVRGVFVIAYYRGIRIKITLSLISGR